MRFRIFSVADYGSIITAFTQTSRHPTEDLLSADDEVDTPADITHIRVVRLRNPANQCATLYVCHHIAGIYCDLARYTEPNRGWLLNDQMSLDGTVFMTTIIDPLFLVLPYLMRDAADRFVPLDQVLKDERCADVERFADTVPMSQWLLLADQRGAPELRALRYSEEKTLNWLAFKCDRYVKTLTERKVAIEAGARSQTYVKSDKQMGVDALANARLSLAIGLLCDHLPKALHEKLMVRVGAERAKKTAALAGGGGGDGGRRGSTSSTSSHKRRPTSEAEKADGSEKKYREGGSSSSGSESPGATSTERKETAKDKAMAKAAQGTKGIMSFFKPKGNV